MQDYSVRVCKKEIYHITRKIFHHLSQFLQNNFIRSIEFITTLNHHTAPGEKKGLQHHASVQDYKTQWGCKGRKGIGLQNNTEISCNLMASILHHQVQNLKLFISLATKTLVILCVYISMDKNPKAKEYGGL